MSNTQYHQCSFWVIFRCQSFRIVWISFATTLRLLGLGTACRSRALQLGRNMTVQCLQPSLSDDCWKDCSEQQNKNCPRVADFPTHLPKIFRPLTAIVLVKAATTYVLVVKTGIEVLRQKSKDSCCAGPLSFDITNPLIPHLS